MANATLASAALAALASLTAHAQVAEHEVRTDILVTATRAPRPGFDFPAAIDAVSTRAIQEDRPQVNLSEAINRVPGIVVQNRQNYAQDLQISSRGFGGRSTFGVRGARLIADGIPATMPDGQGQAASFALASAERIEVLRGPFASLYGNASGGVVQVFTADGPAVPTAWGSLFLGSHATRKAIAKIGGENGAFNYIADVSRFETDGYRDHSAATRDQFNAKVKSETRYGRLTLLANALEQPDTQDPLGLTRSQWQANPRQVDPSAIQFNTRKSIYQSQAGAVYDAVSWSWNWNARAYAGERAVVQFLGQTGDGPLMSGGVVDLDRAYGGAGLRASRAFGSEDNKLLVSAGFDADRMKEHRRGFVNNSGVAGALRRDEDDVVSNTDFYTQAEWSLEPRWVLSGGARHSRVRFDSRDHYVVGPNPDDSGALTFTRTTPVAGVLYRVEKNLNLYVNAGEGFETPTFAELAYRPGGATGLNFALRPARSRHVEAGLKMRTWPDARLNVAVFRIGTRDEIVVNSASGGRTDFKNASRTSRRGVETSYEGRLPPVGLEFGISYTYLDARFDDAFASGTPPAAVVAGARLPGVPRSVLHAEATWRHAPSGFRAGAEIHSAARIYVNEANTDAAPAYTVVNLRAGFEQKLARWQLSEFVRVENVADRRYAGSVIVSEARGRFFEPAPGRNAMIGIQATLTL